MGNGNGGVMVAPQNRQMPDPTQPEKDLSEIIPRKLYLSSRIVILQQDMLRAKNIGYVLSITMDSIPRLPPEFVQKQILLHDASSNPIRPVFEEAHNFIDSGISKGKAVLVHCEAGISRSATIVTSYLMRSMKMPLEEAFLYVRSRRSIVQPNFGFMKALREFECELFPIERENKYNFLVTYIDDIYNLSQLNITKEQIANTLQEKNEDLDAALLALFATLAPSGTSSGALTSTIPSTPSHPPISEQNTTRE